MEKNEKKCSSGRAKKKLPFQQRYFRDDRGAFSKSRLAGSIVIVVEISLLVYRERRPWNCNQNAASDS